MQHSGQIYKMIAAIPGRLGVLTPQDLIRLSVIPIELLLICVYNVNSESQL